jgi:hypothetical protein
VCIDEHQNIQYFGVYARLDSVAEQKIDKNNPAMDIAKMALPNEAILFADIVTEKEFVQEFTINEKLA